MNVSGKISLSNRANVVFPLDEQPLRLTMMAFLLSEAMMFVKDLYVEIEKWKESKVVMRSTSSYMSWHLTIDLLGVVNGSERLRFHIGW